MKLKYIFFTFFALIILNACEKELNTTPEQSLPVEASFIDEKAANASLNGAYSRLQDLSLFGSVPQIIADYMADNVEFIGSYPTLQAIYNYTTLSDNLDVRDIFMSHYRSILASNAVIYYVPGIADPGFTDKEKAQIIGEAKFLRALVNFNMVNLFGQPYQVNNGNTPGIALVLLPEVLLGKTVKPARSSVAEVYAQIEQDLKEALPTLVKSFSTVLFTRAKATKGAAYALLSRLYLYKGDWANSITYADSVLSVTSLYGLAANYKFYDQNTNEDVFTIQNSATDNGDNGWSYYYTPAELGGRGDCPFSANLLKAYDPKDVRLTDLKKVGFNKKTYTTKFPNVSTSSDNAPVIRVTEVVLNKAEAMVKNTNTVSQAVLNLINPLRKRAGLADLLIADFPDAATLLNTILDERRKELCFEGHRRMDLLRNGLPLRTEGPGTGASSPGDPKVVLPIPQREIDLGSSLPQNAGY